MAPKTKGIRIPWAKGSASHNRGTKATMISKEKSIGGKDHHHRTAVSKAAANLFIHGLALKAFVSRIFLVSGMTMSCSLKVTDARLTFARLMDNLDYF
jgi:hypothetical protein